MTPVIIEMAINGVTPKSRNHNVPRLPMEIAEEAIACLDLGASIIHNHIDDLTTTGQAAADRYAEGWAPLRAAFPDVILCPTAAIAPTSAEQLAHLSPCALAGAAMAPLDPGSLNICDTDERGLPGTTRFSYINSFDHIEQSIAELDKSGLAPSIAIYEPSFLRWVLAYNRAGLLPKGSMLKFYFGGNYDLFGSSPHREQVARAVSFGLPPTPAALDVYLELLGDEPLPWAVACLGGNLCETDLATHALARGGHLRVGLEDYGGPEQLANTMLLRQALTLCERAGRSPADSIQTRALLNLPAAAGLQHAP